MKTIAVVSLGGTIASVKNETTGLLSAGVLTGEELLDACDIDFNIKVEVHSIMQIPSNHMTFDKLLYLKDWIDKLFKRDDVDGIVVTHGTDTLEDTAYFLDLTISDSRPLVITGAQLGPTEFGTDALINVRQAILVAGSSDSRNLGTLVAFNGKIFTAKNVTKFHTSNVNGFTSYRYGYIGIVDLNSVFYYQKPVRSKTYKLTKDIAKVEIVKFSLGTDASYIRYLTEMGYKGIILEGYGRGHVNSFSVKYIEEAIEKGLTVVIVSACKEGQVAKIYDYEGSLWDLLNRGVISGSDYDSRKAKMKLSIMLASDVEDIQKEFDN